MLKQNESNKVIDQAYTYNDVLIVSDYSDILPSNVNTVTKLTNKISLNIPIISAAMDTVTESQMAITMAQNGGIGCIHKNMSIERQADEIRRVKRFESGIVLDPITVFEDDTLGTIKRLMLEKGVSGFPVLDSSGSYLVGIITNRDIRFSDFSENELVKDFMTKDVITVQRNASKEEIKALFKKHKVEKLVVTDNDKCVGLITVKDTLKTNLRQTSTKDERHQLRVLGAVGVTDESLERAFALFEAGVDALIIDTAHAYSKGVLNMLDRIRSKMNIEIIVGNIANADAIKPLYEAGASAIKVGIGPGSICTTRIVTGVGYPQFSAVLNCSREAEKYNIPIIADGGIKNSGDIAKAIGAGANSVMLGNILAGTDESPGQIVIYEGNSYKEYRGMGSIGAMISGSADRYFQSKVQHHKLVPEGVEARVPYKGSVVNILHQMIGGLKAGISYTGNQDIESMRQKCKFVSITDSGIKENHPHSVTIIKEAPNYS